MSRLPTSRPTGVLTGVDYDEGRRRSVGVGSIPRGESYAPLLHVAGDALGLRASDTPSGRSEERRVGKECRSRWSPYH